MAAGKIKIVNKGITIQTKPLPEFIQKIADCGNFINYVSKENTKNEDHFTAGRRHWRRDC